MNKTEFMNQKACSMTIWELLKAVDYARKELEQDVLEALPPKEKYLSWEEAKKEMEKGKTIENLSNGFHFRKDNGEIKIYVSELKLWSTRITAKQIRGDKWKVVDEQEKPKEQEKKLDSKFRIDLREAYDNNCFGDIKNVIGEALKEFIDWCKKEICFETPFTIKVDKKAKEIFGEDLV